MQWVIANGMLCGSISTVKFGWNFTEQRTFQMAEVAIPRTLFREILRRMSRLKVKRPPPIPG